MVGDIALQLVIIRILKCRERNRCMQGAWQREHLHFCRERLCLHASSLDLRAVGLATHAHRHVLLAAGGWMQLFASFCAVGAAQLENSAQHITTPHGKPVPVLVLVL